MAWVKLFEIFLLICLIKSFVLDVTALQTVKAVDGWLLGEVLWASLVSCGLLGADRPGRSWCWRVWYLACSRSVSECLSKGVNCLHGIRQRDWILNSKVSDKFILFLLTIYTWIITLCMCSNSSFIFISYCDSWNLCEGSNTEETGRSLIFTS